jgi:hypothetical protein
MSGGGSKPGERRGGRKKGSVNKVTREFRETVTKVLEDNSDNVGAWLEQVALVDPAKALDLIAKLAEYAAPKLSRAEHTGGDGGPLQVSVVRFTSGA